MMITRKADYAIRCILLMAESPKDVMMVNEIASEREIPKSFLAKILQKLARAGIVKSLRGVKGGFTLAKKPADITLLDVVETIDGTVAMNRCAVNKKLCSLSNTCSVHPVWMEIRKEVESRLKSLDFARLAALNK